MTDRTLVLISHVEQDGAHRSLLEKNLATLTRSGRVVVWDPSKIEPGRPVQAEVDAMLSVASAVVLLLSVDYLAHDARLAGDLPAILARQRREGLRLVPVLLRPCDLEGIEWLTDIQCLPRDRRPISTLPAPEQEAAWAAIAAEIRRLLVQPGAGSASAQAVTEGPSIDIGRMPLTARRLFGRERELERLDAAWADPRTHVLSIVAWGGMGKSALVNTWLASMQEAGFRGAEDVFGWSFADQGAEGRGGDADVFVDVALRRFGDPRPAEGSPWDKGKRLAKLVSARRTLLVLDGLEQLQAPPGPEEGTLLDPALQSFLRAIAVENKGLCVVTSRIAVADLESYGERAAPSQPLERLSTEAGVDLLRALGVKGPAEEIAAAVADYDGHCLALQLLGSYLGEVLGGDIRRRGEIKPLENEGRHGHRARRVMASYDRWLSGRGDVERALLRLMGLFDGPADGASLAALLAPPAIHGLTDALVGLDPEDLRQPAAALRRIGLLGAPSEEDPEAMETHPLVRQHFSEELQARSPEAFREGHSRLFGHLQRAAKELPETIEEMEPLCAAVSHGCRAGKSSDALEAVLKARIQRYDRFYGGAELGAFGAELRALRAFFKAPWRRLEEGLSPEQEASVLREASFCLRALGRFSDAIPPLLRALEMDVGQARWLAAGIDANNLRHIHFVRGNLAQAEEAARDGVAYADRSGDPARRIGNRTALAEVLHHKGALEASEALFLEAEAIDDEASVGGGAPRPRWGHRHCALLLAAGKLDEARRRVDLLIERGLRTPRPLDAALDKLVLGRVTAAEGGEGAWRRAAAIFDEAIADLRRARMVDTLVLALSLRAEARLMAGDPAACAADLSEALPLAIDTGMRLLEADVRIVRTGMLLSRGDAAQARVEVALAATLVRVCNYGARTADVARLESRLT